MAVHNGIVDGGENAPAIEEGVGAGGVIVRPTIWPISLMPKARVPAVAKGSSRVV
jgi:hypothetical protein